MLIINHISLECNHQSFKLMLKEYMQIPMETHNKYPYDLVIFYDYYKLKIIISLN